MSGQAEINLATTSFLLSISNSNTQKSYKAVIEHFSRHLFITREVLITATTGLDILLWRQDLENTGGVIGSTEPNPVPNSLNTVEYKTSILSSFFNFLTKPQITGEDPLLEVNPVNSLQNRHKPDAYQNSKKISIRTLVKMLKQIDVSTIRGLRDYALIYGYYVTGKRNSEWVRLKWKDINWSTETPEFVFKRKGQKTDTDVIPTSLLNKLVAYLRGRWGNDFKATIPENAYIFCKTNSTVAPITERQVLEIIKSLASKAGIDPKHVSVHSLRHLHAQSYLDNGANVEEIRARLRHKNISTTQKYIQSLHNDTGISEILDEKFKEVPRRIDDLSS